MDFELVERASGMTKATPGDHRHGKTAGRGDRRQHQRDIVADAAGGVFVCNRPADIAPVEDFAGITHRQGQSHGLVAGHA